MKKICKFIATIVVISECVCASVTMAKDFNDVPDNHWAKSYITELSDKEIISGYNDGSFKPQGTITRAEFIKLIASTSKDVVELTEKIIAKESLEIKNWYDVYVAATGGLMEALPREYTDEELNKPITRVEVGFILNQFCNFRGLNKKEETSNIVTNQDEYTKIMRKYAKENKFITDDKLTDEEFYEEFTNLTEEQREKVMQDMSGKIELQVIPENDYMEAFNIIKQIMIEEKYINSPEASDEEVAEKFSKLSKKQQQNIQDKLEAVYREKVENQSYDEAWAIYEVGKEVMLEDGYIQSGDITEEEFTNVLNSMNETDKIVFQQTVAERYYKKKNQVFFDVSSLSFDELAAVVNIKKYGIIEGYDDGSFKPYNNMTRAEAATVISKFLNVVEEANNEEE